MRYVAVALLLSLRLFAQSPDQPGVQYSAYQLLLVQPHGEGFLLAIDKQQKIVFVPISSVKKALDEDGVLPVRYGDLRQLLRQLGDDNARLKAENDHLWKVAEGRPGYTPPPATVVVQQPPAQDAPPPDPLAERRQARLMLLQSLMAPRSSTVNVNVRDCTRYPALCAGR